MQITGSFVFAAVVLSSLGAGCAFSPLSAIAAHREGRGTTEIYDATFDEAWTAAHIALAWDGAGTPEDHPERQFVITNHPSSEAPSFNDQVGIWFRPLGPHRTRVSVVVMTAPEPAYSIIGPDESSVQKDIARALALVKNGATVEEEMPE